MHREPITAGGAISTEMAQRIRDHEWSATALGAYSDWPGCLRTAADIVLGSALPAAVCWGRDFFLVYNDGYRPILGRKHPQALGRPTKEVFPEAWSFMGPLFDQVRRGFPVAGTDQLMFFDRAGFLEEAFFSFSYGPILDERGDVGGVFVTALETTSRVLAERRFETIRSFIRATLGTETTPIVLETAGKMLGQTPDLPFVLVYRLSGFGDDRDLAGASGGDVPLVVRERLVKWLIDEPIRSVTPVEDFALRFGEVPAGPWRTPIREAVVLPITAGVSDRPMAALVAGLSPHRLLDEPYRAFLEHLAAEVGAAAARTEIAESHRERERLLDRAERARVEAEAANRSKDEFLAVLSHELRSPLSTILTWAHLLNRGALDPQRAAHAFATIERNAQLQVRLVDDLLDVSRIVSGKFEVRHETTDLGVVVTAAAEDSRPAARVNHIELDLSIDGVPIFVRGDAARLEQVIGNLLSNAVKFTPEGGRIFVHLARDGGHAEVTVRDTGIGFTRESATRIFDRFEQADRSITRKHGGLGLGLAIARSIVELHAGEISAESPGERCGATFRVRLPLDVEA